MKHAQCFQVITFFILHLVILSASTDYPIRYQPELDHVRMDKYISNKKLFNIQVNCLLFDGPCDIVGKFVKPRLVAGLLGICLKCTPNQAVEANKLLKYISECRPDLFKLAIRKYLEDNGITPPKDFRPVIASNGTEFIS